MYKYSCQQVPPTTRHVDKRVSPLRQHLITSQPALAQVDVDGNAGLLYRHVGVQQGLFVGREDGELTREDDELREEGEEVGWVLFADHDESVTGPGLQQVVTFHALLSQVHSDWFRPVALYSFLRRLLGWRFVSVVVDQDVHALLQRSEVLDIEDMEVVQDCRREVHGGDVSDVAGSGSSSGRPCN